jgi:hypothetical protein
MIKKFTENDYIKAKSSDKLQFECENCGTTFYIEKKRIKYALKNKLDYFKYCSHECSNKSKCKKHETKCETCGKVIIVNDSAYKKSKTKRFFCSKSCAAKYNNKLRGERSQETKDKIKKSLFIFYHPNDYSNTNLINKCKERTCLVCGKKYTLKKIGSTKKMCSVECSESYRKNRNKFLSEDSKNKIREGGKHSSFIQNNNRRSKNEKLFCELCEKRFKTVKHNEPLFNGWDADIIIEDIKYAILWNGKWHYEKIKERHSLIQVQNRDRIKIEEIKKFGYKPYIIKDMGKYNAEFVKKEFEKFLQHIASE